MAVTSAGGRRRAGAPSSLDALACALLALGPAALLARRRHPRAVLAFVFGVTLVYVILGYVQGPNYLSLVFAVVAAAKAGDRRQRPLAHRQPQA